jgi:LPXTG-motif cell wall-anchored protein
MVGQAAVAAFMDREGRQHMATNAVKAALAGSALIALGLAAPAPAGARTGQADPPGNNGTVKIDGVAFDDHPDNEPHVGCVFQIDFYGFDQGDLDASVTFTLVAPTAADGDLVAEDLAIGEDAAGGGTDLDASATYDLSSAVEGMEPHAQQGIHVRLTVHAEGSQGADTKYKEFWIAGCGTPPPSTTTTTKPGHGGSTTTAAPTSTTSSTTPGASTTTTKPGGGTPTSEQPTNPPGGPATTAPAGGGGAGQLPLTGANAAPLAAAGLALVTLGSAAGLIARRLRHTGAGL